MNEAQRQQKPGNRWREFVNVGDGMQEVTDRERPGFTTGLTSIEADASVDAVPMVHLDIIVVPDDCGKPNASVRAVAAAIYCLGRVIGDAPRFAEEAWRFLREKEAERDAE